jgi:hypothetical protein
MIAFPEKLSLPEGSLTEIFKSLSLFFIKKKKKKKKKRLYTYFEKLAKGVCSCFVDRPS